MQIDRELIERITREVVSRLQSKDSLSETNLSGRGLLAVLTGNPVGVEESAAQLIEAGKKFGGLTAYLTRCADSSSGEEIARRAGASRILKESDGVKADDAVKNASAVVFPNCTITIAAKIGLLISDDNASSIGVRALVKRVPVVIASNSLMTSLSRGGYVPPEFQSVGTEHIERLRRVGVTVCDIRELASKISTSGLQNELHFADKTPQMPSSIAPSVAIECSPLLNQAVDFVRNSLADDPSCIPCAAKVNLAIEKCIEAGACRVGSIGVAENSMQGNSVARMIDHTLLKANATPEDVEKICKEAREYKFKSVCVNSGYASLVKRLLRGSGVLTCVVVGFPLGAMTTASKAAETRDAVADGADEIDMVINIGALKAGDFDKVKHDIEAVVEAAKGRTVKVILETHLLTDEEKVAACQLAVMAGTSFVKTSTGFGGGGATAEDIALMRRVVGPAIGVKASGGVRTREDAEKMIKAGASRIGASASIAIVTGKKQESKGY